MKILVTGGAGFIGNRVLRLLLDLGYDVVNVDSLTEAASLSSVWDLQEEPGYVLEHQDISDAAALSALFEAHAPDGVIHLASDGDAQGALAAPAGAVSTNIMGTFTLLEVARSYWQGQGAPAEFRVLVASSADVFGVGPGPVPQAESAAPTPSDPHGASKAAVEHLTRAWHMSFGFPVLTCRGAATYGPWQQPGSLLPLTLARAITGEAIPVDMQGTDTQDWLHVEDHARALVMALQSGRSGAVYNISSGARMREVDLVRAMCRLLQLRRPSEVPYTSLITDAEGAPRTGTGPALDDRKFREDVGWAPEISIEAGLATTIDWYLGHSTWLKPLLKPQRNAGPGFAPRRAAGGSAA